MKPRITSFWRGGTRGAAPRPDPRDSGNIWRVNALNREYYGDEFGNRYGLLFRVWFVHGDRWNHEVVRPVLPGLVAEAHAAAGLTGVPQTRAATAWRGQPWAVARRPAVRSPGNAACGRPRLRRVRNDPVTVAEDARFELARGCPQHAFQVCGAESGVGQESP